MSKKSINDTALSYCVNNVSDHHALVKLGRALSSFDRLRVLELLQHKPYNLLEISNLLNMPISSVSKHIDALADAQLIFVNYQPGKKGHTKVCSKMVLEASIRFDDVVDSNEENKAFISELPIGAFGECSITPPCGMLSGTDYLGDNNSVATFFQPQKFNAGLLWFNTGFLHYYFPKPEADFPYRKISFSFEMCSEAPYYRENWPSDITVCINDVEVVNFTSEGDYGGRRGVYSPDFWPTTSTQFGLLENITVSKNGVYHNAHQLTKKLTLDDLALHDRPYVKFSIGIKPNATHRGGMNLFGKNFGDFNQAIVMKIK